MDPWLTNNIKVTLNEPCLQISRMIGTVLDNFYNMGNPLDEPTLTDSLVDSFDTRSKNSIWGNTQTLLKSNGIHFNTMIQKTGRKESSVGADIGITMNRGYYDQKRSSRATYSVLVQCKKIDSAGEVDDFFHETKSTGRRQSRNMLDITPSSFYFIFVPPRMVKTYLHVEPVGFAVGSPGCHVPVLGKGCFPVQPGAFGDASNPNEAMHEAAVGLLVVPALAVDSQIRDGKSANLPEIISNSHPFWYWFTEMFFPGHIGDDRDEVVRIARNVKHSSDDLKNNIYSQHGFGVNYSIDLKFQRGG